MILQHLCLSDRSEVRELYSRTEATGFPISSGKNEELDLRAFFNLFSLDKWSNYANIDSVTLDIDADGLFSVDVHHISDNGDTVLESFTSSGGCSHPLTDIPKSGMLGITLRSLSEDSVIRGGGFSCDKEPVRKVRIGLDICTFRREQLTIEKVTSLTAHLNGSEEPYRSSVEIYVIDNGSTLAGRLPDDDKVHLILSENLGGSGGFTRGMIEIVKDGFTHVLLNDDDAVFDPEVLYRTWAFASMLSSEHEGAWIGGTMLDLVDPVKVCESGARSDIIKHKPAKRGLDVSLVDDCLELERYEKLDYFGWWYCLIPCSVIKRIGYPLPLFIREDDVEYGLRSNSEMITLGCIAVWHRSFIARYSPSMSYYFARNILAIGCVTGHMSVKNARHFLKDALFESFCYRYASSDMMFLGIKDFMKGPESAFCGRPQNIELLKDNPELPEDLTEFGDELPVKRSFMFRMVTMNGLLLPANMNIKAYTPDLDSSHFYRVGKALYKTSYGNDFIAVRSRKRTFFHVVKYVGLYLSLSFRFKKLSRKYADSLEEYSSEEHWKGLLRL
jgi:glycosyltransferase involved in cell wall biosynthesis